MIDPTYNSPAPQPGEDSGAGVNVVITLVNGIGARCARCTTCGQEATDTAIGGFDDGAMLFAVGFCKAHRTDGMARFIRHVVAVDALMREVRP